MQIITAPFLIMIFTCLGSFSGLRYMSSKSIPKPEAKVTGIAVEKCDARVMGVRIIFEGQAGRFETTSNDEGEFTINLPPGEYDIKYSAQGFFDCQRAKAVFGNGELVKLYLRIGASANWQGIGPDCIIGGNFDSDFAYDSFSVLGDEEGNTKIQIQYPRPELSYNPFHMLYKEGNIKSYRAIKSVIDDMDCNTRVMATFGISTVLANEIYYDKEKGIIEAKGNVYIIIGNQEFKGIKAVLSPGKRNPLLSIDQ